VFLCKAEKRPLYEWNTESKKLFMETSILTSKGKLPIPKSLRIKYGINPGIKVAFIEAKNGLIIKAMDEAYFEQFVSLLKDKAPSLEEFRNWKNEEKEKEK
jgi:bifunctional DNA-binding transcriptional regulator/antitoxin component of YhaV-PrlF toxin-antitoxin module